ARLSLVLTDKLAVSGISVMNIVAVGRYPYTNSIGKLKPEDLAIINKSLSKCGLQGFENRLYAELSDGEKQRVMIARALAQDTPLMMLDEPTAHLDLPNRIEMMKTMRKLAKETQKAILISTHELDLALQWADTIWIMDKSGTIETGTPEDLVLNDALANVFENDSFFFDMMAGNFKMRHDINGTVELIGSGVEYEWTKRALSREGFDYFGKQEAFTKIKVLDDKHWTFQCGNKQQQCNSIAELLTYLRHESYYIKESHKHSIIQPSLVEEYV
ncbi:ABC transporter ATP-binding protein, partial [candidate division KSB1 bacterium]|nr:ABC transporter ATP-binding protein [candidate division KSB1 bacterium]